MRLEVSTYDKDGSRQAPSEKPAHSNGPAHLWHVTNALGVRLGAPNGGLAGLLEPINELLKPQTELEACPKSGLVQVRLMWRLRLRLRELTALRATRSLYSLDRLLLIVTYRTFLAAITREADRVGIFTEAQCGTTF